MDRLKSKTDCTACGACLVVCPARAIEMKEDRNGFLFPEIDEEKCIHCNKCRQVCRKQDEIEQRHPQAAYAAVGRNCEFVKDSASGGVFAVLAKRCIEAGGLVAGAVLDCGEKGACVYHILSDSAEDLRRMQGSKYVQSCAWECYDAVNTALKKGRNVLFCGTPCQVSALKSLTGDPDNLITMDLICHGVPSLRFFNDFLQLLSMRFGGKIIGFLFRDKTSGKSFCARIDIQRAGKRCFFLQSRYLSFYQNYLDGNLHRENCYICKYAGIHRTSDITVGDYWGIEQFHREDIQSGKMPERKDWSCVLVNTVKGSCFLKKHSSQLELFSTELEWIVNNNSQLKRASTKGNGRDEIFTCYCEQGYRGVEARYIRQNGGCLRFYWRMLKSLYRNAKIHELNKG